MTTYKLQIRYASKKYYQTIETSATGVGGLVWGFRQCLVPYGVAGVRILGPNGNTIVRANNPELIT